MNSYERHKQVVEQSLHLYYSIRELFGKQMKRRLFKKWHHRYMRERNRYIKRLGKQNQKLYRIYFGRIVYTYYYKDNDENRAAFTCRPRCKHSHSLPINYALHFTTLRLNSILPM